MTRAVTRLAIAACTRRRPRMFGDLLSSLMTLAVPQGTEIEFFFVENDAELSIAEAVDDFARRSGWPARAILMPEIGIVQARNAALDAASTAGADWLAFVDDDELVRHDWLRNLWSGVRDAGAQMGGGPLVPVAPASGCSDSEAAVLDYLVRTAAISDARKEAAARAGRRFDLATNNWIADIAALRSKGLRFDPRFNLSGGEDTDLSRRAHQAGLTLAWVPGAVVTEEVPAERLSARYIFDRSRHQSMTKMQLSRDAGGKATAGISALGQVIAKGIGGAIQVILSPLIGRYHYYRGLRALGVAAGFLSAFKGGKQRQYSQITGD